MFQECDFMMGADDSIVIVIPATLPHADTYTVSVSSEDIKFKAGFDEIAQLDYKGADVFKRIVQHTQIGLVEHPPGGSFPSVITNVAYVEVRRAS